MRKINPVKAGLTVGIVLGLWHLAWALLVALNWAQPVVDFVLRLHFAQPFLQIQPFDAGAAAVLVAVTGLVGFVIGGAFALVWNQFRPASGPVVQSRGDYLKATRL